MLHLGHRGSLSSEQKVGGPGVPMERCYCGAPCRELEDKIMYHCYVPTPLGDLLLAGDEEALCLIGFPEGSMRYEPDPQWIHSEYIRCLV